MELALNLQQQIEIAAPPDKVFRNLLIQLGQDNTRPDGLLLPMKLEPVPGGRWFRDLGGDAGHFWGHVQVIKPSELLEICGPLFMSYPAVNFLQYRLAVSPGGTVVTLKHQAIGPIAAEHASGVQAGWSHLLERVKQKSE